MEFIDVVAILGALAWFPQIISWIYTILKKPVVSIYHDDESEVGFIKNGCAFNLRLSFLARKKHALIDDIELRLIDKNGAVHNLKWMWYSETLYELQGPGGNATMAKQQNAIAINAYQDTLIEKFVGFQSVDFIEQRRHLSYQLMSFIENQKSGGDISVEEIRRSKEYNDLFRLYKNSFVWKAGKYDALLYVHIADKEQVVVHKFSFYITDLEEDALRKNLDVAKIAIESEFIDPSTPLTSTWFWAKPTIISKR